MKTTKKINHDSLWIKVSQGKNSAKLVFRRRGVSVEGTGPDTVWVKAQMNNLHRLYTENNKLVYGQIVDLIEAHYNETVCK